LTAIFLDGINTFSTNVWEIIIVGGAALLWGAWLHARVFQSGRPTDLPESMLYYLCMGILSLVIISWTGYFLQSFIPAFLFTPAIIIGLSGLILIDLTYLLRKFSSPNIFRTLFKKTLEFPGLFVLILVVLRLNAAGKWLYPPYIDSPVHYAIINNLVNPNSPVFPDVSMAGLFQHYYHFGFHTLISLWSMLVNIPVLKLMVFFPLLFSALVPFPIYYFLRSLSLDKKTALYGSILGGLGWGMPAYGINWGKYPAVLAVTLLPLALAAVIDAIQNRDRKRIQTAVIIILGLILLHSRIVVVIPVFILSVIIQGKLKNEWLPIGGLILLAALAVGLPIYTDDFDRYYTVSTWMVLLLSPLALKTRPHTAFGMILFSTLMVGLSQAPLLGNIYKYSSYLIDRPFLEICLYIPLTVIGGLGLEGLFVLGNSWKKPNLIVLPQGVFLIILLLNGFSPENYLPSPETNFVTRDDITLIEWISSNVDSSALIYIPGGSFGRYSVGVDAGIWLSPQTHVETSMVRHDYQWQRPKKFISKRCADSTTDQYVYIGSARYSFSARNLDDISWFDGVMVLPKAKLYRIRCDMVGE